MIIEVVKKTDVKKSVKKMVEEFGIEAIENDEDYYLSNMYNFIGNIYEIDLDKNIDEQLKKIEMTKEDFIANLVTYFKNYVDEDYINPVDLYKAFNLKEFL